LVSLDSSILLAMIEPSRPQLAAICLTGAGDGSGDDIDADLLVAVDGLLELVQGAPGTEDRDTAAGEDAFFDGRAAGVQGVLDSGLLLLHFDFGGRADVDLGDAAGHLGEAFFELLAVVVAWWSPRSGAESARCGP